MPPTVSITTPANNANLAQGTVTIGISAQAGSGNLTKIEILDGAALLTSVNTPAVNSFTVSYPWTGMVPGSHTLTARATNTLGGTRVSAAVVVQIVAPPTPPTISLGTLNNFYLAGSNIDLTATAVAAGTATITRVEFYANNGSTNTLIGTITTAPYNFRWTNVAAANYTVTAKVTDSLGIAATSAPVSVTVSNNVSVQIAAPLNGSTVDEDTILVSGTVSTVPNSAVSINGRLASVTGDGRFFLNDLNLQAGQNTITATFTAPDGQTANQTITITRSATAPLFEVSVGPGGIVIPGTPVDVDVTIASAANTAFATVTIECVSPGGGVDVTKLGTYKCRYADAGTFDVKVTVKNAGGVVIYSVGKRVTVLGSGDRERLLRSVYSGMLDRLKAGNITGALNALTSSIYDRYQTMFTAQGTSLGALVDSLGTIQQV